MERRTLNDALEAVGRLGLLLTFDNEVFEFRVEVLNDRLAQRVEVDAASAQHRRRVDVVDQRQQQMLERRIFMTALVGERQAPDEGSFRARGRKLASGAFHFFSMMHCRGCWFLRAWSITCDTLVSAIS